MKVTLNGIAEEAQAERSAADELDEEIRGARRLLKRLLA